MKSSEAMKLWSSQFLQLRREAWKIQDFNGVWNVTSWYRRDALTSWAMKPLTLGAGHLWVLNDEMIYEMDHKIIWTADMKSSEAMSLTVMNAIFAIA